MFRGSGGSKSRLAEVQPLWRAHVEIKMPKLPHARTTFWRLDCHPMSKKCTPCGVKHISQLKYINYHALGPLMDLQMSFRCRESARRCGAKHISELKMVKSAGCKLFCCLCHSWCEFLSSLLKKENACNKLPYTVASGIDAASCSKSRSYVGQNTVS